MEDVKVLHGMGYAQELDRRMKMFSNFAISFSIICILAGGITTYPVALSSGGPFSVTIGWVIGGVFAMVVAASLGQIASAYPTAGGLYHWSSILGGRAWGWVTARGTDTARRRALQAGLRQGRPAEGAVPESRSFA